MSFELSVPIYVATVCPVSQWNYVLLPLDRTVLLGINYTIGIAQWDCLLVFKEALITDVFRLNVERAALSIK